MAYTKQDFKSGDKLYASQLNAMDEQIFALVDQLEKETVETAESIEWLNEYGDTSKRYALPDKYIYAYMQKTTDITHNANDGTMLLNTRPSPNTAMGNNTTNNGIVTTLPIEIDNTWSSCIVNISGLEELVENFYSTFYAFFYKADGSWIGYSAASALGFSNTLTTLPISVDISQNKTYWSQAKYVRMALCVTANTALSNKSIDKLVVNFERLNTTETVSGWYSTGELNLEDGGSVRYDIFQGLTEEQKAQARANIGATAGDDVEFADSIEWLRENGNTSRKYVLPDGFIYAWTEKTVHVEHNANDGTGYLNSSPSGTWGNSSFTMTGGWTSPLISIDPTEMAPVGIVADSEVTISGIDQVVPFYNGYSVLVYYYKQDGSQMFFKTGSDLVTINTKAEKACPFTFKLKDPNVFADSNWAQVYGVRISLGVSSTSITADDVENLKVSIPFFDYEHTGYDWYSTGRQHSNDKATQQNSADIALLKEEIEALKSAAPSAPVSSGAVWYAMGDSITYGLYSTSATEYFQPVIGQRWVDYVAKYNGYELTNLGVSGSGFVSGTTFRTIIDRNDFSNVDLVTIMLGVNDWKNDTAVNKVGTMEDEVGTSYTDKIVPELRYGLEKIISQNPYCKIILITPINAKIGSRGTEATNWAYGYTGNITPCGSLKNFGDKLKEVCEYYGIQVVDMTNSSVVNRKSITTVLPDGIHPNLECYKALGLELARRITFA